MFARIAVPALLLGVCTSAPAWAQVVAEERPYAFGADIVEERDTDLYAPRDALEIGVHGGYTQPFGEIQDGRAIMDSVDAGGAFGLDIGWRLNPRWSLGFAGQYHESMVDDRLDDATVDIRGLTATVQATIHFTPYDPVDPYVSLGTGYRGLWTIETGPRNDLMTHGFQIARGLFGVDFRVARDFALGPVVGADMTVFVWENPEGPIGNERLSDLRLTTFLFAGVGGRFDIGGRRESEARAVAWR